MTQQTLTQKESRMLQAAQMRYMEGMGNESIAEELGVSYSTVSNYFSSDEMNQFKEYFSDEAKQYLKVQMKQRIEDGTNTANSVLSDVIADDGVQPATRIKAAKEAQKIPERYIKMMQELGVIKKPKDRKEVTEKQGTSETLQQLSQAMKEKEEGDESDE